MNKEEKKIFGTRRKFGPGKKKLLIQEAKKKSLKYITQRTLRKSYVNCITLHWKAFFLLFLWRFFFYNEGHCRPSGVFKYTPVREPILWTRDRRDGRHFTCEIQ